MLIGNLLARSIGRRRADISHQVKEILLSNLTDEGAAACGLEASEVENLCDNAFDYLRRTMLHPTVHETIEKMAKELVGKATLTREQILSALVPLQRL
jgi:bacterioferritin (cytochrome b1)